MEARSVVSRRIEELRLSLGLSQKDFGAIIGVNRSMVNNWEQGTPIKSDNLTEISKVFGASADWLLGLSPCQAVNEDMKTANLVTGLNDDCLKLLQGYSKKEAEHDLINRLLLSSEFSSRFLPSLVEAYFAAQIAIQAGIDAEISAISSSEIKDTIENNLRDRMRDLRLARFDFSEASMALFDDLLNMPKLIRDIEAMTKSLLVKRIEAIRREYDNGEH